MKLIRSFAVCIVVALGVSLAPCVARPAAAAGVLLTSQGTFVATSNQTVPLGALFTPSPRVVPPQYINVVVALTGGLTFPGGAQIVATQGPTAFQSAFAIPVTAKGSGNVTVKVIALVGNAPTSDEATEAVDVLFSVVGNGSATSGENVKLSSLFKFEFGGPFTPRSASITLTGGLFFDDGKQSLALVGDFSSILNTTVVTATSAGTVTISAGTYDPATGRGSTPTARATAKIEVLAPAPVTKPAPVSTVAPVPTVAPAPGATAGRASAGNEAPVAVGKSLVVAANTATAIALEATDAEGAQLAFSVVVLPEHGRLTGRAPNLIYLPDKGFAGTDAFSFTVSDGVLTSEEAVVSLISAKQAVAKKAVARRVVAKKVVVRRVTKKKK